jgi:hypothetical protein
VGESFFLNVGGAEIAQVSEEELQVKNLNFNLAL